MKKLAFALICGLAVAATSCSDASNGASKPAAQAPKAESFETSINIRYVSMDSILNNYTLAKTVSEEARAMAIDLQSYQNQLANQLQKEANAIQQKAQNNGYLSEASYNADMKSLNNKQNSFQNEYARREMKANQDMALRQQALMDSINNFIIEFNKERKYDAILLRDAGLFFNPALDITPEVIEGLNARYKAPEGASISEAKK